MRPPGTIPPSGRLGVVATAEDGTPEGGTKADIRVEISELVPEHTHRPARKSLARSVGGWLERIEGTRLVIRMDNEAWPLPMGTLVEIETADELFLGEIKHGSAGRIFVDFEHELKKPALDELRGVWRRGNGIS